MLRLIFFLVVGPLALVLSGCAGPVNSYVPYKASNYDPAFLGYGAKKGGIFTEITNPPFPDQQAATDQIITRTLEESHFGPPVNFYVDPALQQGSPYRVRLAFSPAQNANADRLCRGEQVPVAEYPEQIRVMAAFCTSDYRYTSTVAWIPRVESPDDPTFTQLMRQVGVQIFPPRSEPRDPGNFILFQ